LQFLSEGFHFGGTSSTASAFLRAQPLETIVKSCQQTDSHCELQELVGIVVVHQEVDYLEEAILQVLMRCLFDYRGSRRRLYFAKGAFSQSCWFPIVTSFTLFFD